MESKTNYQGNPETDYTKLGMKQYQQPPWAQKNLQKRANNNQIQKVKKALTQSVAGLKQDLLAELQSLPLYKTPLAKLGKLAQDEDATLKGELEELRSFIVPKDYTAKNLDVTFGEKQRLQGEIYQAKQELFKAKTGHDYSGYNARSIATILELGKWTDLSNPKSGSWYHGFNDNKLLDLVLLDDFDLMGIVKKALPFIATTAGPLLDTLIPGAGSMASGIINKFVSKEPMEKTTIAAGRVEQDNRSMIEYTSNYDIYAFDRVDVATIASTLLPGIYKNIARFDDAMPAARFTAFYEIPVIPSTTTGGYFFIFNGNTNFATIDLGRFISYTGPGSAMNPVTGAYIANSNIASPLTAAALNITAARLVGADISYKPTAISNTTYAVGQIDSYHDPSIYGSTADLITPSPYFSLTNIGFRPFYQRGPVTSEYSQVWYNPLDQQGFMSNQNSGNILSSPIVFLLSSGNTAGVQVGTIVVKLLFNVIPTAAGLSSLPVESPGVGPYTADVVDTFLTLTPQLYMSKESDRAALVSEMKASDMRYGTVCKIVNKRMQHIVTAQPYSGSGIGPQVFLEE